MNQYDKLYDFLLKYGYSKKDFSSINFHDNYHFIIAINNKSTMKDSIQWEMEQCFYKEYGLKLSIIGNCINNK